MPKPFRKNASIIPCKNGKFLLVKKPRTHHAWQFPQGGVEKEESFEEAARREFVEELGTDKIKILREAGIYFYDWSNKTKIDPRLKKFRGQEVHLFFAEFFGEDIEIKLDQNELSEWQWVDTEQLKKLIESPKYLEKILEIIDAS